MKKTIPVISLVLIGVLGFIFLTDNLIFISKEENDELVELFFASTEIYTDALSLINIDDEKSLISVDKNIRRLDKKIDKIASKKKYKDYLDYHEDMMIWSFRSIETKKEIIKINDKNNKALFPQIDMVKAVLEQEKEYLKKFKLKVN